MHQCPPFVSMKRSKNPLGHQDFRTIRTEQYYYVDKTPHIRQLIDSGSHYFLSRPRRFGKSMLVSTLKSLFEGEQSLFEGLDIYDRWDWSVQHPVIRISFGGSYDQPGDLESSVQSKLSRLEKKFGIEPALHSNSERGSVRLERLLEELHEKTSKRVAVLVDEYDKPILDVIKNTEMAELNRDYLGGFYSVIKDSAEHVRFVFVTGITMFSKVSLFSGLNNLDDISLESEVCDNLWLHRR